MIRPDVRAGVAEAEHDRGWSSISSTASMRWLRNGKLNSARPGVSREIRTNASGDRLAGALRRARAEAVVPGVSA